MANISIRKENGPRGSASTGAAAPQRWEPARLLRDLLAWDPFGEMTPLASQYPSGFVPQFEVKETKDGYVFKADVPGVKESDLQVTLTGNRLAIAGRREAEHHEQSDTFYAYERSYGDFSRTFTLPEGIDSSSIGADLKDGVLTVSVRRAPEQQPRKIEVQTPSKKS